MCFAVICSCRFFGLRSWNWADFSEGRSWLKNLVKPVECVSLAWPPSQRALLSSWRTEGVARGLDLCFSPRARGWGPLNSAPLQLAGKARGRASERRTPHVALIVCFVCTLRRGCGWVTVPTPLTQPISTDERHLGIRWPSTTLVPEKPGFAEDAGTAWLWLQVL